MDNIKKKIGTNLKRLRLARKLKQSELAELVGVEDKTISRIEVGGNYPSMDLLVRLSNVLECELIDFVNFNNSTIQTLNEFSKEDLQVIKKFIQTLEKNIKI